MWDRRLMSHPLGAKLGKYKHMIVIAVAVAAFGAYFLPLSTVFAAHTTNGNTAAGANNAARGAIANGHPSSSKSNTGTTSNSGTSSPSSNSKTNTNSRSATSGDPNIGNGNTGQNNVGNLNSGNNNVGNCNTGDNNIGNGVGKYGGCATRP